MRYIDLTQTLSAETPAFPGDPDVEFRQISQIGKDDFLVGEVKFSLHTGTHLDAPAHFIKNGKLISDFAPEKFFGRGVLVDARGKGKIDADLLVEKEIRQGDIIIVLTGWDNKYDQKEYFEDFPEVTKEFAQKLIDLKINIIGLDTPSPDKPWFEIHKLLLPKDILIIENLTNLETLLQYQNFEIIALPAKFAAEAAPCRVVAKIE